MQQVYSDHLVAEVLSQLNEDERDAVMAFAQRLLVLSRIRASRAAPAHSPQPPASSAPS